MNFSLKALFYLTPGEHSFWKWSDDCSVITWSDGDTIAFKEEIKAHLSRFTGRGLPALECFLLILAATRSSWPTRRAQLQAALAGLPYHQDTVALLDRVHHASHGHCESVEARAALLFLLTDRIPSSASSDVATEVLGLLDFGFDEAVRVRLGKISVAPESGTQALDRALRELRPVLDGLSEERLQLLRQTGADELPAALPDIELSPAKRARALLRSLQQDHNELAQVASLASQMMAAVSLPRKLQLRDHRPIGGISDISNRGSLDRLLLSELAHDDVTLAVRVATNEAMYLRRESPPTSPPQRRTVLLDAGIRTWGIPRLYVCAVGLALQATADDRVELDIRSLLQNESVSADLTTRKGLTEQLSRLSPDRYPTESWDRQLERWQKETDQAAPVFVTTVDTMSDAPFLARLQPYLEQGLLVVTVDRTGCFELTEWSLCGSKLVRSAQFDLIAITRSPTSLVDEQADSLLPAIDRVEPFPLLLGPEVDANSSWYVSDVGGFHIAKDGRLMFSKSKARGARQLLTGIGQLSWCSRVTIDGKVLAIAKTRDSRDRYQLVCVEPSDMKPRVCDFELSDVEYFCSHERTLLAFRADDVVRLSLQTGETRESIPYEGLQVQAGIRSRFLFQDDDVNTSWYAVAHGGRGLTFERVPCNTDHSILWMFEVPEHDGILGLDTKGRIVVVDSGNHWGNAKLPMQIWRPDSTTDRGNSPAEVQLGFEYIELKQRDYSWWEDESVSSGRRRVVDPMVKKVFRVRSLRSRLHAVGYCPGVGLILEAKGASFLAIHLEQSTLKIKRCSPSVRRSQMTSFKPVAGQHGLRLSVAKFPGGEIFLDRRGLLHLKSRNASIPEATLVLHDANVAGWLSTGDVFGSSFFHDDTQGVVTPRHVYDAVIAPFIRYCEEARDAS